MYANVSANEFNKRYNVWAQFGLHRIMFLEEIVIIQQMWDW